jgi:hypothetical protein
MNGSYFRLPFVAALSREDFMKYLFRHAGAVAALMLGAFASLPNASGQNQPRADPADANAPVPATRYAPLVFAPIAAPSASSPADRWKALNQAVASYDAMSLTMDMAEPQATPAPHADHAVPPAPKPDPHSQHGLREVK